MVTRSSFTENEAVPDNLKFIEKNNNSYDDLDGRRCNRNRR